MGIIARRGAAVLTRLAQQIQRGWQTPGWLNWLLLPLAKLNQAGMALRVYAYQAQLCRSYKLPRPVVVVGNLCVGGSGKTPLVIALVDELKRRGYAPGVVSRGYGRADTAVLRVVAATDSAADCGDEALLIYRRCGVPTAVCADRVRAARCLVADYGCDVLVSDDGFQHLRLQRDVDVVVVDAARGFGNGWCLPAGPLREAPAALSRADVVVVNLGHDAAAGAARRDHRPHWWQQLPLPTYTMHNRLGQLYRLNRAERRPLRDFCGQRVHAVAGLGQPQRFFAGLEQAGLRLVRHEFADHHAYRRDDFAFATPQSTLIMSEKDAVKCEPLDRAARLPGQIWVLPLEAGLSAGFFAKLNEEMGL